MRAAGLVGTLPPSRTLRDLRDIAWHAPDLKLQRTLRSQVRPLRTAHGASYQTLHRERIGVTDTCGLRRTKRRRRAKLQQSTGAAGENRDSKEGIVDWNLVEASWQRFRDEVHANWGRLTSAHLDLIAGSRARLASKIEEAYGVTSNEAERQVKNFEARNQHPRTVSFR